MTFIFDSLDEVNQQLITWKQALRDCSLGKEFVMGSRRLTREDVPEIRETLSWLAEEKKKLLSASGPVILQARPRR